MARIHVLRGDALVPLADAPFDSEDDYQRLLADHPELMPGEEIDPERPPRFALITREAGIALADSDGGNRWSLDHLFVDQFALPTLVEVKRAQDTRARREVVAQMLDYAANLRVWPVGRAMERFEYRCATEQLDPRQELEDRLGAVDDYEAFWAAFDRNIAAGAMRLVWVADEIRPELERIIEFLDAQFGVAEAVAVEIRQLAGNVTGSEPGERAFISTVKGKTATSDAAKNVGARPRLTHEQFRALVTERAPQLAPIVEDLMTFCDEHQGWVTIGTGASYPSCYLNWHNIHGSPVWAFAPTISAKSYVSVSFAVLETRFPWEDPELRNELLDKLNSIDGISLDGTGYKGFPLSVLTDPVRLEQFKAVLEWFATVTSTTEPTSG